MLCGLLDELCLLRFLEFPFPLPVFIEFASCTFGSSFAASTSRTSTKDRLSWPFHNINTEIVSVHGLRLVSHVWFW